MLLTTKKHLNEELRQTLEDLGWEYICSENPKLDRQNFHLFRASLKGIDSSIIDNENNKIASKFKYSSILNVLTSRKTIVGFIAFMSIIIMIEIDNIKGRNFTFAIFGIIVIGDLIRHYFERTYEKEFVQAHKSKNFSIVVWEEEEQRYKRINLIIRIISTMAMMLSVLLLR